MDLRALAYRLYERRLEASVLPIVRFSVSEKANAFVGMKLSDEFYFATAGQIYRILVSPQAKKP